MIPLFELADGCFFVSEQLTPHRQSMDACHTALLKIGEVSVVVRPVHRDVLGTLHGSILGFEPSFLQEHAGLRIGDEVQFESRHMFGCGS